MRSKCVVTFSPLRYWSTGYSHGVCSNTAIYSWPWKSWKIFFFFKAKKDECVLNVWYRSSKKGGGWELTHVHSLIFIFNTSEIGMQFMTTWCSIHYTHNPPPTKCLVKFLLHLALQTYFHKEIQYINLKWSQFFKAILPVKKTTTTNNSFAKIVSFWRGLFNLHSFKQL